MTTFNLSTILNLPDLPSQLEKVDLTLNTLLDTQAPAMEAPLRHVINAGGKRLRPSLVVALATSQKGSLDDTILTAAAAVEMIHLGSLVHDDIIDAATMRWNKPTVNATEGTYQALLVGDHLFAGACRYAATVSQEVARLAAETIMQLCDGESRELSDQFNLERPLESLIQATHDKTATLFSTACQIGGICGDFTETQISKLALYGEAFGMSFQLIDDMLDFLSTASQLGKPVGNDFQEGMYTMPLLFALRGPHAEEIKTWLRDPRNLPWDQLITTLLGDGSIAKTVQEIKSYNEQAAQAAAELNSSTLSAGLAELPHAYLDWALKHLVAVAYHPQVLALIQ